MCVCECALDTKENGTRDCQKGELRGVGMSLE